MVHIFLTPEHIEVLLPEDDVVFGHDLEGDDLCAVLREDI